MKRAVTGLAALALVWASPAEASPTYPADIASRLMLASPPACTVCHTTLAGGVGTITQPFGVSMRAHGLVAENPASLTAALDTMAADHTDSVCDGTPDIDDLRAGRDPNIPDGDGGASACTSSPILTPRYGCGAAIANPPHERGTLGASLLASLLLAMSTWRRRRPHI